MPDQAPRPIQICGKGTIAARALTLVRALPAYQRGELALYATPNRDDPGADSWYPSLRARAEALGVPLVDAYALSERDDLLLLSLEYDRIIRVERFASGALYNIHFSALPAYRGVYTSIWPILNGEEHSGVTLHELDPGVDTGPIVAQRTFPLAATLTCRELYDRYMAEAFALLCDQIGDLLSGRARSRPQDEASASLYDRKSIDFASMRELDPTLDAETLARRARAFYFPEYQTATWRGRNVRRVTRVALCPPPGAEPGHLLGEDRAGSIIAVGRGEAALFEWHEP